MGRAMDVGREQALAFRLAAHGLAKRLPPGSPAPAAAACCVQDTPPGGAVVALCARVEGVTEAALDRALAERALLRVRSLRTAPHVVPAADLAVFTAGLLPEDEESLRFFVRGAIPALDEVGISGTDLARLTADAVRDVLDGRVLPFRQLSSELTERLAQRLAPGQLAAWRSPSPYGPNQCLGEALVHFALYVVSLQGVWCFAGRQGEEAALARTDQWLGRPLPPSEPTRAGAELLRRYLRCYGPSTAAHFGEWAGISLQAAARRWDLLAHDLVPVTVEGRKGWLHGDDLTALAAEAEAAGVRLLPPHDPYLGQRDRDVLLVDAALRRQVWRNVGSPGAVLVDGELVATWRAQKQGKRLIASVAPFAPLAEQAEAEIRGEAERLAASRGLSSVAITFAS
jgi:hypothetical protein